MAAVLFGLTAPVTKLFTPHVGSLVIAGLFYLGSGLALTAWRMAVRGEAAAPLSARDARVLAAAIFAGGVLAPPLQVYGIQHTQASTASLLLNLEAVFTAGIAWVVVREHVHARTVHGMLAIVLGSLILSWSGPPGRDAGAGALAIAAACLLWAIDNNLTQKVSGTDPVRIAAAKGLVGGAVNLGLALALGGQLPAAWLIGPAMVVGLLGYGVSLVLFVKALRELGTARTGAYFSVAPFVGAVAGVAMWREPVTAGLLAAGALMAWGVWLHLTEHHEHTHRHEPLSHSHAHTHDEHHRHAHGPDDPAGEPHTHAHTHERLEHSHPHFPDIHHRHDHDG
jgi:drug/metabolite transporter (DMT)-like permease